MFCVGITLYNPQKTDLTILGQICPVVGLVLLYDNSEVPDEAVRNLVNQYENIVYFSNKKNDGISYALNKMADAAIKTGWEKIIFFDQDSVLSTADLVLYMDNIISSDCADVAMFSPNIICDYVNREASYRQAQAIKECEWVITSGSCLNLSVYKQIGRFDQNLFIDLVDTDFCIRSRLKGYRLLQFSRPVMRHSLGDVGSFCGISYYRHSPLRVYYQVRNKIYLFRKHRQASFTRLIFSLFKVVFKIILLEERKFFRLKMIFRAFDDARNGRMGKYID